MTGRYQTRFGHEWNGRGPEFGLPVTETTMADRLRALGYATCAIGKWHLGETDQFVATRRGFDEFFGTRSNSPFFHPTIIDTRVSTEAGRASGSRRTARSRSSSTSRSTPSTTRSRHRRNTSTAFRRSPTTTGGCSRR
jgi:arylsulfatase A-like enzyme